MGGRPRTATNLLELRGAFKQNPQRKTEREFEPMSTEPIGDPPKTFDADELQAWNDIVTTAPVGLLTILDRIAVESASRLLARERLHTNSDAGGRRLDTYLGRFGMTPADRSKVQVPKKKPSNPFEKIVN